MKEPPLHDHAYEKWSYRQQMLAVEDERDVDSIPGESTAELSKKALSDLEKYNRMTVGGNTDGCLIIEEYWGLDGFPPSIVTEVLSIVGEGETIEMAMERLYERGL